MYFLQFKNAGKLGSVTVFETPGEFLHSFFRMKKVTPLKSYRYGKTKTIPAL